MPRRLSACSIALVISLGLGAASCVPPEPDEGVVEHPPTTRMGELQAEGVVRIGVDASAPPMAFLDDDGALAGFTVELGAEIAERLGIEAVFVSAPTEFLPDMLGAGDIDIAFPYLPITEETLGSHPFSDPYWIGHQRLLVRSGSGIASVDDLAGRAVCESVDPITGVSLRRVNPDVGRVIEADDVEACQAAFEDGEVDAMSAPDLLLLSLLGSIEGSALVGEQLRTAGYGAMVSHDASGLDDFIDSVLLDAATEGHWDRYYERFVSPVTGLESPGPPEMTMEEAAALWPAT